jgi:hypothetical protein
MPDSNQNQNEPNESSNSSNVTRKPRYDTLLVGLVLIGLGVTLLLATLNPGYDLRQVFFTWWPLLLVGAGLAKVLQAMSGSPSRHSGIGWLVFAAIVFFLLSSDRLERLEHIGFNWGLPFKELISEISGTVDVEEQTVLILDLRKTDVTLVGTSGDQLEIVQKVYGSIWNKKKVEAIIDVEIDLLEEEGTFLLKTRPEKYADNGLKISMRLELRIPENMEIEFSGENSDIDVHNFTSMINIKSEDGDVNLSELEGEVEITLNSGDIEIDDIIAGLTIKGKRVDIELTETYGDIFLDLERSSVDLSNYKQIDGDIDISTTRGSIELELNRRSDFRLDADADGGKVEFDFGSREISRKTAYKVSIGDASHTVKLRTRGGSITIEEQ